MEAILKGGMRKSILFNEGAGNVNTLFPNSYGAGGVF